MKYALRSTEGKICYNQEKESKGVSGSRGGHTEFWQKSNSKPMWSKHALDTSEQTSDSREHKHEPAFEKYLPK